MKNTTKRSRNRKGAATVEFAFVAPLLFALIFGMVECSRGMMVWHATTGAARAGARLGIIPTSSSADVQEAARAFLTASGIDAQNARVSVLLDGEVGDPSAATRGQMVQVDVAIDYADVSFVGNANFFTDDAEITGSCIMRTESPAE